MPLTLLILWLHFFWCLVPSWRDGLYYEYGFIVAPLAVLFAWRRMAEGREHGAWGKADGKELTTDHRPPATFPWFVLGLYLLLMIPLRMVEIGDPTWRPPVLLHAILLTALTHWLVARSWGWKVSWFFVPVTIFALSAVPYPWQVEQALVRSLTGGVIGLTREAFLLDGQPVQQLGERLVLGGQVCEVTDGCSGIRSIQSLVMAALFFGELLWLRWPGRLLLVGVGLLAALACNVGRAWYLAVVHFSKGPDAAQAVHDTAGHLAFAIAALVLFGAARAMMPGSRGRVVRRKAES
ncbi:archaeosortase/exosortase family protein [Luteolibacter marinus]|uniref:archaeosortase/exosortase family protein n=1 Tax=Luteolibacter marinus TaxID=2776705 RepID=UPI001867ABBC